MKIKKAIITAAGYGTRFFPVTKAVQKEMLPLLSKPIIDYLVDDCIKAGVEEIIFVVNENNDQIRQYYSEDQRLLRYLTKMGKMDKYQKISDLHTKAKFTFLTQQESDVYGTAVPVMLAKDHVINEEAFLVLMGDDFFINEDGSSEVARMIEVFTQSKADGMITCIQVPHEEVHKYGIAEFKEEGGYRYLTSQLEKPQPHEVTSNIVTISKYIFKPSIYKYFSNQKPDERSGEMYLTTTYSAMAQKEKVLLYEPQGKYIDSGDPAIWLNANLYLAKQNPDVWSKVSEYIKTLL
jgi:UTP--glucose-1-phosphate uridylyltransferase